MPSRAPSAWTPPSSNREQLVLAILEWLGEQSGMSDKKKPGS